MRIFGVELRELDSGSGTGTIVVLDADGAVATVERVGDLSALAREVSTLTAGEPFLLAVDVPVAVGAKPGKPRRVDGWLRRRLGVRIPASRPDGAPYPSGSDLLTAFAMAGHPCLPYPDRDRRQSGLAEIHPELVAKALIWESSTAASAHELPGREAVCALSVPEYRSARTARARHGRTDARSTRRCAPFPVPTVSMSAPPSTSPARRLRPGVGPGSGLVRRNAPRGHRAAISRGARALRVRRLARRGLRGSSRRPVRPRVAPARAPHATGHAPLFRRRA